MSFIKDRNLSTADSAVGFDEGLRAFFLRIYNHMAAGLAVTGLIAWVGGNYLLNLMQTNPEAFASLVRGPLFLILAFAPVGIALYLGFRIQRMSVGAATTWFYAFAVLMGMSLSSIFVVYTGASIARVFFITAITFGGMSLYGYTTKRDLTGMGSFLIMGVWGLFIGFIINMFLKSGPLDMALSAVGVLIFTGLIAYDTQKLKSMYYQVAGSVEMAERVAIMGALNLYLDVINLFMMLLRFFGQNRE
jgi:FtsH-binding integral membrane protein